MESVNFHIKKLKIVPLPRAKALGLRSMDKKPSISLTLLHRRVKITWKLKIVFDPNSIHQEVIMNVIRLYPPPVEREKHTG